MKNPLLEEAAEVYIRSREYVILHIGYIVATTLFAVLVWPTRGLPFFFRTGTAPASFQATIVAHVIAVTAVSLTVGLDRLAEARIIRHTEWLERTSVPVRVLFTGKALGALIHTLFLVAAGIPLAVLTAGPSGIPLRAVVACEIIVLLSGLTGRFAGMLISHLGEDRYVIRITGGWLFMAALFIATVQLLPALNPIVAVAAQHAPASRFMQTGTSAVTGENPLLTSGAALLSLVVLLAVLYWLSLLRHRAITERGAGRER